MSCRIDRREFVSMTAAGALVGCGSMDRTPCAENLAGDFVWGALLHLGSNMWGDWSPDVSKLPSSRDEETAMHPGRTLNEHGVLTPITRNYLRAEDSVWRKQTELAKSEGLNLLIVDIGEGFAFPSHPELWVAGSWDEGKLRCELARIRAMGIEPVPKLNFSTGHDMWLKDYHRMTSSAAYYKVVRDVIRDVAEAFDCPRYFHIGFDEEILPAFDGRANAVIRQGDLWWHDLFFAVGEVEKRGARAMMWSDKICGGREEFLRRMSKGILQVPWYYGDDFSDDKTAWDPKAEKLRDSWDIQRNLPAALLELGKAGFDMMPCTSNWDSAAAPSAMLKFCRERLDSSRIKGYLTASWARSFEEEYPKTEEGIRVFAEARRKYVAEAR